MTSLLRRLPLHLNRPPTPLPLPTTTEFLAFTLSINKATAIYGLLALFTGYALNPLQLSHYIYSLAILALTLYLTPSIKGARDDETRVLKVLALAWCYVLDTVISMVYTAVFGWAWFAMLSSQQSQTSARSLVGGVVGTMNSTAGFTDPEHDVEGVEVIASPGLGGQTATAIGVGSGGSAESLAGSGAGLLGSDNVSSLTVLTILTMMRIYACLVILSYARVTVRQYIAASSANTSTYSSANPSDTTLAANPFSHTTPSWKGRLGRAMLRFPTQHYWLGRDEGGDEWERQTSARLESARGGLRINTVGNGGIGERERRARSGTGPPVPFGGKGKVLE
ncbi:hypothetical protein LTR56_009448 [Elasticomyces elasticus]|nr:hypothetical protein LTR56_009448 [Elasticomyces elasticus]KAK3645880.1 hypothetical protein LTR22_014546 [Elasticomyces elasticus]